MKVLIRQFLGKNHSWSIVGWGLATALINKGHEVHLFSTDGNQHLPEHLKNNLIGYVEENKTEVFGRLPDCEYDCQIGYTSLKNFSHILGNGSKNRLGIWSYEWQGKNVLPNGFAKGYKFCDYLVAPSEFSKTVFENSGIPTSHIKVVPHGIDAINYKKDTKIELPTNKKFKILANIAQLHLRKNIPGLLDAYGKAFTKEDDVCLILKTKDKPIKFQFDVSLDACLKAFKNKYPKHAEIKILSNFIDDMSALYRSIDCVFTMAHAECFYFPGLEALAAGKLNIAPNWGGQLQVLNKENSYLIEGSEVRADPKSMYWESKSNAIWFQPSVSDAVIKLQLAYKNYETINQKLDTQKTLIHDQYSWDTIATQMLGLCK